MDVKIFDNGFSDFDLATTHSDNGISDDLAWTDVMDQIIEDICDNDEDIEDDFEFVEEMITTHDDFADRENEMW